MSNVIDEINLRTMRSAAVVAHYAQTDGLLKHEQAALDLVAHEIRGGRILDIGVGGGRTVKSLLAVSPDCLGVGCNQEMVDACRTRFPGIAFEHADARSLSNVRTASICLAVFSCNGISMVGHNDRLSILREVHRVLKPGGVFLFTTYNRNSAAAAGRFRFPDFRFSPNPARLLVRLARLSKDTAISLWQRARHRKHEVHNSRFAVLNDVWHNYGVMLHYITLSNQRLQLEEVGFESDALVFDATGERIDDDTVLDSMAFIARTRRSAASARGTGTETEMC